MLSGARRRWIVIVGTLLAFGLLPAGTALAVAPGVVTGGAALVNSSSATLTGTVNPQGLATRYYFQYGGTAKYGARTPSSSAGAGKTGAAAVADLTGLTPNTRYHYRLVAHNRDGTRVGADRSFLTARQPLALVIGAQPNPVPFGGGTLVAGTLTGTGNSGRQVVLQQNAWPFTTGFQTVGNPLVTNAAGGFSFPLLSVPITTQYRVSTLTSPAVISPPISVGVSVKIVTRVRHHRVRKGARLRFEGLVRPAKDGVPIGIQRLGRHNVWVTVAGSHTRHGGPTFSRFSRRVKIVHSGVYRVFVQVPDGSYASNAGSSVSLRLRRR
jgi:hypothetical protein